MIEILLRHCEITSFLMKSVYICRNGNFVHLNKLTLKYHTNSIRNKLAFEVAHEGYQNQKENLQQQQQQIASIKQGQIDENETVEIKVIDEKKKKKSVFGSF